MKTEPLVLRTGYFAKAKEYADAGFALVSIALKQPWFLPKDLRIFQLMHLAPSEELLALKDRPDLYAPKYMAEVWRRTAPRRCSAGSSTSRKRRRPTRSFFSAGKHQASSATGTSWRRGSRAGQALMSASSPRKTRHIPLGKKPRLKRKHKEQWQPMHLVLTTGNITTLI